MKRVTKAGNTVVNRRLTGLAIITGMVLLFSSGISVAATDFKLFHKPVKSEKFVELAHISDAEKAQAVDWLKTNQSEENIIKFVTATASEPFKFAEGLKEVLKTAENADAKKALVKDLKEKFNAVNELLFGSSRRKMSMLDILSKLADKDLNSDKLLEEVFDSITREELALLTELPKDADKKSEEEKKKEEEKQKEEKTWLDRLAEIKDFLFKQKGEGEQKPVADNKTATDNKVATDSKATETPKAVDVGTVPGNVGSTAQVTKPVGEQLLPQMVQQVCDLKAAQDAARADQARSFESLVNGLNDQLNQEAIRNRFAANNKKNDGLEAAAAAIAQSLNDNGKGQNAVSAPPAPPPAQPVAQNQRRGDENQPLPVPSPEPSQQQPPPQQVAPFTVPQLADNGPVRLATGNNLPFNDGLNELDRAESISASLENRTSYTKQIAAWGPNVTSAQLAEPLMKLDAEINRANSALQSAQRKAKDLDRDLQLAKEGARKPPFINENDLRREKQYEQEFTEKKEAFDQEKQMIQQQVQQIAQAGGDASGYQQQANQYLTQKQQELAQAKKRKEQFTAELDLKVEGLNGKIKTLAAQRDDLKAVAADIEGKLASMKSEQSTIGGMYAEALKRDFGQVASQVAGAAKQFGNNAATILGYGGSAARGAAAVPGKLQRGSVPPANQTAATGNAGRGMLGSKGTPTL